MSECIELHDSELTDVSSGQGKVVLAFSPAYIHRSGGRAGIDAGTGWLQESTWTIAEASFSPDRVRVPAMVLDGALSIDDDVYENCVPSAGVFDGQIELRLLLDSSESLIVRGCRLTIVLDGEARYLENFDP